MEKVGIFSIFALLTVVSPACSGNQGLVPETTSSANSVTYAVDWSENLGEIRDHYREGAKTSRGNIKTFSQFPGDLNEPDWALVTDVYSQADQAGRSRAVAETLRAERQIRAFIDDSAKAISWRVAGHVNSVLKTKNCQCEFQAGGTTQRAIKDAVDQQLDERYHRLSEAYQTLDKAGGGLSKRNRTALEGQIDTLTKTSFFVFVDSVMLRDELDRMMEELETVRETLKISLQAEKRIANSPDSSRSQKKQAQERISILESARPSIDGVGHNVKVLRERIDEDILDLRDQYTKAFEKLLEDTAFRTTETSP